jgi:hypothetical protein
MKYANAMNSLGAIVVVISAILKIFHLAEDQINLNLLLISGFLLGYIGQSWKLRLLEKEIKDYKAATSAQ